MFATLLIHYQLIVRQLAGLDLSRRLPGRVCAGDPLEVDVTIARPSKSGAVFALHFREQIARVVPSGTYSVAAANLFFPEIEQGCEVTQRYPLRLLQRGLYTFAQAELQCRYPFGLLEGACPLQLADRLVVCPPLGKLHRAWYDLLRAEKAGQQRSRHRRGLLEAEFYALREWRTGDSRRWIHWRTSAKQGSLAVRQFEERDSFDFALVCDLWLPAHPTPSDHDRVEELISFAATILVDRARHGGARLTFHLAGRAWQAWQASASALFVGELLEQLAVCEGSDSPDLNATSVQLSETTDSSTRVMVISTRGAASLPRLRRAEGAGPASSAVPWEQAIWINLATGEHLPYFARAQEGEA
jgi:uncharacterized protein (DUF58 family)